MRSISIASIRGLFCIYGVSKASFHTQACPSIPSLCWGHISQENVPLYKCILTFLLGCFLERATYSHSISGVSSRFRVHATSSMDSLSIHSVCVSLLRDPIFSLFHQTTSYVNPIVGSISKASLMTNILPSLNSVTHILL